MKEREFYFGLSRLLFFILFMYIFYKQEHYNILYAFGLSFVLSIIVSIILTLIIDYIFT